MDRRVCAFQYYSIYPVRLLCQTAAVCRGLASAHGMSQLHGQTASRVNCVGAHTFQPSRGPSTGWRCHPAAVSSTLPQEFC